MKRQIGYEIGDQVQWPSRKFGLVKGLITHLNAREARISVRDAENQEKEAYIVLKRELQPDSLLRFKRITGTQDRERNQ